MNNDLSERLRENSCILIVDDDYAIRETIKSLFFNKGYTMFFAENGKDALEKARIHKPDLILLDALMPEIDGFEVCRRVRESPDIAELPIVMITVLEDRKSRLKAIESGADDYITKPFDRLELQTRVSSILRLNRYRLLRDERNKLKQSYRALDNAYDFTLQGWARALEFRDQETEGHSQRVVTMTLELSRFCDISESDLIHIKRGALLHDIGKMGIPDSILLKPGPLTTEEFEVMKKHPLYAYQLLSPIDYLKQAIDIPYCHHEKWDGTGYPRGLVAEKIPLAARIFTIIDVYDALSSDRPYRPAWAHEKIIDYLQQESGGHFDPRVLSIFLKMDK